MSKESDWKEGEWITVYATHYAMAEGFIYKKLVRCTEDQDIVENRDGMPGDIGTSYKIGLNCFLTYPEALKKTEEKREALMSNYKKWLSQIGDLQFRENSDGCLILKTEASKK